MTQCRRLVATLSSIGLTVGAVIAFLGAWDNFGAAQGYYTNSKENELLNRTIGAIGIFTGFLFHSMLEWLSNPLHYEHASQPLVFFFASLLHGISLSYDMNSSTSLGLNVTSGFIFLIAAMIPLPGYYYKEKTRALLGRAFLDAVHISTSILVIGNASALIHTGDASGLDMAAYIGWTFLGLCYFIWDCFRDLRSPDATNALPSFENEVPPPADRIAEDSDAASSESGASSECGFE